jgi:hypothetical protein
MKNQAELIKYYETRLEKVKSHWPLDSKYVDPERSILHIEKANADIEAVKNGRNW